MIAIILLQNIKYNVYTYLNTMGHFFAQSRLYRTRRVSHKVDRL